MPDGGLVIGTGQVIAFLVVVVPAILGSFAGLLKYAKAQHEVHLRTVIDNCASRDADKDRIISEKNDLIRRYDEREVQRNLASDQYIRALETAVEVMKQQAEASEVIASKLPRRPTRAGGTR